MARAAFCLFLAVLFLASVIPSEAQSAETTAAPPAPSASVAAPAPGAGPPEMLYNIRYNFALLCPIPNDKNLEYEWKKNETELSLVEGLKGRYKLHLGGANLTVERSTEEDFGNYSCALPGAGEWRWAVRGRPHLKLDPNTNVVEGQKLKLVCKVVGKPYPRVRWAYSNSSEGENFAPLGDGFATADSEAGVPDGVLLLAAAARAHAGRYRCLADDALAPGETTLRVKDMYAALWPFLGICAEVFVLCAIILLYERRRTKPDLDDSDADNNDQKKS